MPSRSGQSVLEYAIIIGIVTVVLYYMGTGIKRGFQSMIKVTADQVGNQQNSDQGFTDTQQGYMEVSNSMTQLSRNKKVTQLGFVPISGNAAETTNISYNDSTDTQSNIITNGGFS